MKISSNRNTLGSLINERLTKIGASNLPTAARELIEADVWQDCTRTVQRSITGPRVGRAVARALAASAAVSTEGRKGEQGSPLPSRCDAPEAQNTVAGHPIDTPITLIDATTNGADEPTISEGV